MKRLFLFLPLIMIQQICAQTDSVLPVDQLVENFLENSNDNVESSQIYSLFEYLLDNPVDLTSASVSDLMKIPFLDFPTAERILTEVKRRGKITSLSFLDSLKWLSPALVRNIKPFLTSGKVKLNSAKSGNRKMFSTEIRTRLQTDLQTGKGFTENKFEGNKIKNYNRLKINYAKKYFLTLLTEKDAGEKTFTDFYSGNLSFNGTGFLNKVILGDYLVEFGQGLALWSPYAFSKGSEAVRSVIKRPRGIIKYTSTDENRFYRGIALSLVSGNLQLALFYSAKNMDASLTDDSMHVRSISYGGYHRTGPEISKKDLLKENSFGTILIFEIFNSLTLSYLYNKSNYSLPFLSTKAFGLNGNSFGFHSLSIDFHRKFLSLGSEIAYNSVSVASIFNLGLNLTENFKLIFSFRNYPRNYYNLYANGFGEQNNTQNETGFYTGMVWRNRFGVLNVYYDLYRFPYSTFNNLFPEKGSDFLIDFYSRKFNSTQIRLKYKQETKPEDFSGESRKTYTNSIRADILIGNNNFSTRSRIELKYYETGSSGTERGFLLFQELNWLCCSKLYLSGRIIFFNTGSYSTRLYEYEKNIRGIFYNPALFGKGVRWYLLAKWQLFDFLELSLKYSETYKPFEKSTGSGYSALPSNLDNSLSLQVELHY